MWFSSPNICPLLLVNRAHEDLQGATAKINIRTFLNGERSQIFLAIQHGTLQTYLILEELGTFSLKNYWLYKFFIKSENSEATSPNKWSTNDFFSLSIVEAQKHASTCSIFLERRPRKLCVTEVFPLLLLHMVHSPCTWHLKSCLQFWDTTRRIIKHWGIIKNWEDVQRREKKMESGTEV